MLGRNHFIFGVGSSALVMSYAGFDPLISLVTSPIAGYASLIPDIDHWHSKINSKWWVRMMNLPFIILGKRGISHSIWAASALIAVAFWITFKYPALTPFLLPFVVGYCSHILGDMMTSSGVRLFSPLSKKRFKAPISFNTGAFWEYPIAFFPVGLFIFGFFIGG